MKDHHRVTNADVVYIVTFIKGHQTFDWCFLKKSKAVSLCNLIRKRIGSKSESGQLFLDEIRIPQDDSTNSQILKSVPQEFYGEKDPDHFFYPDFDDSI